MYVEIFVVNLQNGSKYESHYFERGIWNIKEKLAAAENCMVFAPTPGKTWKKLPIGPEKTQELWKLPAKALSHD